VLCRKILSLLLLLFPTLITKGQITISNSGLANTLVNKLVGAGVSYSNATLNCASNGAGTFITNQATLGMDSGILLTTGFAASFGNDTGVNKPSIWYAGENRPNPPSADPDLVSASGGSASNFHDMCRLEFDFVPQGDTLSFNYRFGSEEYPEWVCSQYNDIFGFFISGVPNYPSPTNLALVPGTNVPVAINYINSGSAGINQATGFPFPASNCKYLGQGPFPAFFVNNMGSNSIVYDGLTTKLRAVAVVAPCSTYHMKFAIADVFDGEFDSGVFLEAGSFKSDGILFDKIISPTALPINWPYSTEGCNSDTIYIRRLKPKPTPQIVYITCSGTAINGVDYATIPATATIPANDTITKIIVTPLNDALVEGTETLFIGLKSVNCNVSYSDTMTILINEFPNYMVTDDDTICIGSNKNLAVNLQSPNPSISYKWMPGNFTTSNISIVPLSTSQYTVSVFYPGCIKRDSVVKITVANFPVVSAGVDSNFCLGNSINILATSNTTPPFPITYNWTPNIGVINGNTLLPTITPIGTTNYTLTATNSAGCSSTDVMQFILKPSLNIGLSSIQPNCVVPLGSLTVTSNPIIPSINYNLTPNNISNSSGIFNNLLPNNTYTVTATANGYCTSATLLNVNALTPLVFNNTFINNIGCNGGVGSASFIATGTGALSYQLNPSNVTNSFGFFGNLTANLYTVTVTDAIGCTVTSTFQITNPINIIINSVNTSNLNCFNTSTGAINVNANAGVNQLTYKLNPTLQSNTTGQFNNLAANTYTVTITDPNNCSVTTIATVNNAAPIQINNTVTTPTACNPNNTGTLSFNATGGAGLFNYFITSSSNNYSNNSGVFNNLIANTYTILAQDANNCSLSNIVTVGTVLSPSINVTNTSPANCFGTNTGSITTNILNASGIVNYTINPSTITNNNNGTFTNGISDNYIIIATDINGCTSSTNVLIGQPSQLMFNTPITTPTSCNGSNNGTLSTLANGGIGIYSYTLINSNTIQSNPLFTNLGASTYTIQVSDGNGCTATTTAQITQPSTLNWGTVLSQQITCNGFANGSISTTAIGGSGQITYSVNNGPGNLSGNFNNLNINNYTVVAKDLNNCSISSIISITQPGVLLINNVNIIGLTCTPGNDASIQVIASGGNGSLNYSIASLLINQSNGSGSFTNLTNGTYTISATDFINCNATTIVNILVPSSPNIGNVILTQTGCVPNNTGALSINATTPNNNLQYNIGNGFTNTNTFNNLTANNYTITIKDNLNCSTSSIVNITTSPSPVILNIATTPSACVPSCSGSLTVTANGGSTLLYSINAGSQSNGLFGNLCASNYTATVTDSKGCSATSIVIIPNQPNPTISNIIKTDVLCNSANNGSIIINVNGGAPSYSYQLNSNNFISSNNFNNLGPATYTITVKDLHGCSSTTLVNILQPSTLNLNIPNVLDASCNGLNNGAIVITNTGGVGAVNFNILGGSFVQNIPGNFTSLFGGITYTIIATDANNCTLSTLVTVNQPNAILINIIDTDSAICYNNQTGFIQLNTTGGTGTMIYNLNNLANTSGIFNNLNGGSYIVNVTDANNCVTQSTINIPMPPPLNFSNFSNTPISCFSNANGIISSNATGGLPPYFYNINGGPTSNNAIYNNLNIGTYTIQVIDAYNCVRTTTTIITQPNNLLINSLNNTNVDCFNNTNGLIGINTTGGNGGEIFSILPATLTNNTSGTFFPLPANTYTITTTDSKGCSTTSITTITQPNALILSATSTNPLCTNSNNGSLQCNANGGSPNYIYSIQPLGLSNSNGLFTSLSSGQYTVTVTDNNLCSASTTIQLAAPLPISFSSTQATNAKCNGDSNGSIQTNAIGGFGPITYLLQPNNTINNTGFFNNLIANVYTLVATDANNCNTNTQLFVGQNPILLFDNLKFINPRCSGGTDGNIQTGAVGGKSPYLFSLNNSTPSTNGNYNNLILGTYTLVLTDFDNCQIDSIITLNQPNPLFVKIDSFRNNVCATNNSGAIYSQAYDGNPGGYIYELLPGSKINTSGQFTELTQGSYTISARDNLGCSGTVSLTIISAVDTIIINISIDSTTCAGLGLDGAITANPTGGTLPYTYLWQPSNNSNNKLDSIGYGTYTIVVKDAFGCKGTKTASMPAVNCCQLYLPNAFTPNGDGVNDKFIPFGPADYNIEQFEIFDRWGNKVFATINNSESWDGTFKNIKLDTDTYFYIFKYKCLYDNSIKILKGDVILMK
jgi:large repetitive protein